MGSKALCLSQMLLQLYKMSLKKACELVSVVEELKHVFELPDAGNAPIRSEGSIIRGHFK